MTRLWRNIDMSEKILIKVAGLKASAGEKEILKGIDLEIGAGETHVIMGPNGAGKSTLGHALMGNPAYEVTSGNISFDGEDITDLDTGARARKGMFLSFQNPVEVPGVTLGSFIRSSMEAHGEKITLWNFKKAAKAQMEVLSMKEEYLDRELNVGFSGGEKKKAEILQLLMLKPKFAILDETDSGLDVDAVRTVSLGVEEYKKQTGGALLIITHNAGILESLKVDKVHVLADGKIIKTGDASIIDSIAEKGFAQYVG